MNLGDLLQFSSRALRGYPLRTSLVLLAMAIGVASVIVLSALGEGARAFVLREFSALGSHLLIVLPGRSETVGGPPPLLGVTPRDLSLADAEALRRSSAVGRIAPVSVGVAPVSQGRREREAMILGTTANFFHINQVAISQGQPLPAASDATAPVCLLGHQVKEELFGAAPALGEMVRIGDRRFQVIGLLSKKGQSIGMDIGAMVFVPVTAAQSLFNTSSLFRIMVEAVDRDAVGRARQAIEQIIRERHEGEDDITIISQDAVLATFDRILKVLTLTVSGIAAISLGVAGILIMNVMLIAVSQRQAEVGLLQALGARRRQIVTIFLTEAAMVSLAGSLVGLAIGWAMTGLLGRLFPSLPLTVPWWSPPAAMVVAVVAGLLFGVLPARRAARLDPVASLARR